MPKKQNVLLTPEQVAETLKLARRTIVTMAREERIPHVRMAAFTDLILMNSPNGSSRTTTTDVAGLQSWPASDPHHLIILRLIVTA